MIVMISGKQGSGKTTLAQALQSAWGKHGMAVWRYKFAQPLYDMHNAVYIVARQYGIGPLADGKKDGPLLQLLGTEWGRNTKDPDIWVNCAKSKVAEVTKQWRVMNYFHIVLIDDLRFKNEFHAFPGALTIRLVCAPEIRKERIGANWRENDNHRSEVDLDDYETDGQFSITLDTAVISPEESAEKVVKFLADKLNNALK
jgi:dephospho-CoA kinase